MENPNHTINIPDDSDQNYSLDSKEKQRKFLVEVGIDSQGDNDFMMAGSSQVVSPKKSDGKNKKYSTSRNKSYIGGIASIAKKRIRKMAIQTGFLKGDIHSPTASQDSISRRKSLSKFVTKNVLKNDRGIRSIGGGGISVKKSESKSSLFADVPTMDIASKRVIIREMMRKAELDSRKREIHASFDPKKKEAPENVHKIDFNRLQSCDEMIRKLLAPDEKFLEKSKERVGRSVGKLNNDQKKNVRDVLEKVLCDFQNDFIDARSECKSDKRVLALRPKIIQETTILVESNRILEIETKLEDMKLKKNGERDISQDQNVVYPKSGEQMFGKKDLSMFPIETAIGMIADDTNFFSHIILDNHRFFHNLSIYDGNRSVISKLLAEALVLNSNLVYFSAQNCSLDDSFLEVLFEYIRLGQLGNLKGLNLTSNLISEKGVQMIGELLSIEEQSNLTEINIKNQGFASSLVAIQCLMLGVRRNFKITKLEYDAVSIDDSHALSEQVDDAMRVIRLSLRRNQNLVMGKGNREIIPTALEERIKRLFLKEDESPELIINNDYTFKMSPKEVKIELIESLRNNCHLKILKLTNLGLDDEFVFSLADALVDNISLEMLSLEGNYISESGILMLVEALSINGGLKQVYFRNQEPPVQLSTEQENYLINKLKGNTHLNKIDIDLRDSSCIASLNALIQRNCLSMLQNW